jgi:hypothetical protein
MIRWGWRLDSPENGKGLALGRGKCSRNELVQFTRGAQRKVKDVEGDFTTEARRNARPGVHEVRRAQMEKDVEGDFTTEGGHGEMPGMDLGVHIEARRARRNANEVIVKDAVFSGSLW